MKNDGKTMKNDEKRAVFCQVMLKSDELGTYPYTVTWRATAPGFERALVLKAPPGCSAYSEAFEIVFGVVSGGFRWFYGVFGQVF